MHKKHKVIVIAGRTGAGKTETVKALVKDLEIQMVDSYTTREMRESDLISKDHRFITDEEVEQYEDDMIAYVRTGKTQYFATLEQLYNSDIYTLNPAGIVDLEHKLSLRGITDIEFVSIYIYSDFDTRYNRAVIRKDDEKVFMDREAAEDEDFKGFEKGCLYDYAVVNKDLAKTIAVVKSIVKLELGL